MKMGDQTREKFKHFLRINRKLLLMKAHYFCYYGALAGVIPPLVSIFTQLGASMTLVGVLFAVLPFVQCVIKPLTGALVDKLAIPKTVFLICIATMTAAFYSISFIPPIEDVQNNSTSAISLSENSTLLACNMTSDMMTLTVCNLPLLNSSLISCVLTCKVPVSVQMSHSMCSNGSRSCLNADRYLIDGNFLPVIDTVNMTVALNPVNLWNESNCQCFSVIQLTSYRDANESFRNSSMSSLCPDNEMSFSLPCSSAKCFVGPLQSHAILESSNYRFTWIWVACIIVWSTSGTILSTSDANLLNTLGDQRHDYGQTRLFASAGWGLMSVVSAQLIDLASAGRPRKDYSPGFYVFLTLMICDLIVAIAMKVVPTERPKALVKDVLRLFQQLQFTLFVLGIFCVGMVTGVTWVFLIVFLNELHAPQLVIGIYYAMECFISEIPFFIISGWIVNKLGHHLSMSFVLLVSGLKTISFYFVHNPWHILFIAMLHGPNYGVYYATSATYASIVAPPGTSVTLQSVFQALFEGAGVGCGNLIGGILYEAVGARKMFFLYGSACLIFGLLHCFCTLMLRKRHQYPAIQ